MELILGSRSSCNESINNNYFGCIHEKEIIKHRVKWGEVLPSGCIIVENDYPLFYQLNNYTVSSQCSGRLYLCPHKKD